MPYGSKASIQDARWPFDSMTVSPMGREGHWLSTQIKGSVAY